MAGPNDPQKAAVESGQDPAQDVATPPATGRATQTQAPQQEEIPTVDLETIGPMPSTAREVPNWLYKVAQEITKERKAEADALAVNNVGAARRHAANANQLMAMYTRGNDLLITLTREEAATARADKKAAEDNDKSLEIYKQKQEIDLDVAKRKAEIELEAASKAAAEKRAADVSDRASSAEQTIYLEQWRAAQQQAADIAKQNYETQRSYARAALNARYVGISLDVIHGKVDFGTGMNIFLEEANQYRQELDRSKEIAESKQKEAESLNKLMASIKEQKEREAVVREGNLRGKPEAKPRPSVDENPTWNDTHPGRAVPPPIPPGGPSGTQLRSLSFSGPGPGPGPLTTSNGPLPPSPAGSQWKPNPTSPNEASGSNPGPGADISAIWPTGPAAPPPPAPGVKPETALTPETLKNIMALLSSTPISNPR